MRALVYSFVLIITLCLSTTVFTHIRIFGIQPDFLLLIIVSYAILRGDIEGAILGFFAGLLKDIFYGDILGISALLYFLLGYISGKPFKDFFHENHFLPLILAGAGALLYETAFYMLTYLLRGETDFLYYFNRRILPAAIYTLAFSIPVYRLVYFINKKIIPFEKPRKRFF